jgi:hypothetical protein
VTQIIDAEPEVVQQLTFPDVRAETYVWKSEDATDRMDGIRTMTRTFQEAEQTQYHRRREWERPSEARKPR